MNYNFDQIIDRKNTNSVKYDVKNPNAKKGDLKRLWLADMDFETLDEIKQAMKEVLEHNIYGYSRPSDSYFNAIKEWMRDQHDYEIKKDWFVITPGIVFAIGLAIRAFTKEGDGVLIQQPVYYPFRKIIKNNNRKVVDNTLVYKNNSYKIDFADFEEKIRSNRVKLFILCNPHNPVGRVWKKEELITMAEICKKYHVIIVSDEIHQDFVWQNHKHTVLASLDSSYLDFVITCTSPSKTFNLAGVQISNIIVPKEQLRNKMKFELEKTGYSNPSKVGIVTCETGYRYGREWHKQLKSYLEQNFAYAEEFFQKSMPKVNFKRPEGTYLAWVDCKNLGFKETILKEKILNEAGLWLDDGGMFGTGGAYFERFNIACPRSELKKALEEFQDVLK